MRAGGPRGWSVAEATPIRPGAGLPGHSRPWMLPACAGGCGLHAILAASSSAASAAPRRPRRAARRPPRPGRGPAPGRGSSPPAAPPAARPPASDRSRRRAHRRSPGRPLRRACACGLDHRASRGVSSSSAWAGRPRSPLPSSQALPPEPPPPRRRPRQPPPPARPAGPPHPRPAGPPRPSCAAAHVSASRPRPRP